MKIFLNWNLIFGKNIENGKFVNLIDFENKKLRKFLIYNKREKLNNTYLARKKYMNNHFLI